MSVYTAAQPPLTENEKKAQEIFVFNAKSDRKNFPSTNQAMFCWHKYNEFVIIEQYLKNNPTNDPERDELSAKCAKQIAKSTCPLEWVSEWDDQRSKGNYAGVQAFKPDHRFGANNKVEWGPKHLFWTEEKK